MKIYLSHAIRGAKGPDATAEDMAANCQKAIQFADLLRMNILHKGADGYDLRHKYGTLTLYRGTEIYVPAESEEFVGRAYRAGYLTEEQILDIDCDILRTCDAMIAFGPLSRGMHIEISAAADVGIPVYYIED